MRRVVVFSSLILASWVSAGVLPAQAETVDPKKQDELLAIAHEAVVDDAVLVWIVQDTNPYALSPNIKSFVQAQHRFQDLITIGVE
jgi:peptide/nickel transport system substrate-binding protein